MYKQVYNFLDTDLRKRQFYFNPFNQSFLSQYINFEFSKAWTVYD